MKHKNSIRRLACELVLRIEKGQYSNIVIASALSSNDFTRADKALLTSIVYGVTERKLTLDHFIKELSSIPFEKLDIETVAVLRVGLYQLIYLDKVPDHAAIYETVEAAPKKSAGFVNAVLRAYTRKKDTLSLPDREHDEAEYLSLKYSFSKDLVIRFIQEFGAERAESLMSASFNIPPVTLRVNNLMTDRERLMQKLRDKGITAEYGKYSPHAIKVSTLPDISSGEFFVEDEASQICVSALELSEGMTLADVCACPGSKSFGSAMEMNNKGHIYSFDLHRSKLSLIESGAKRLGIDIITTAEKDARLGDTALDGKCDRVLCDVPCSGFGVISKKPEIKYHDVKDADRLPEIQKAILHRSSEYIKHGGMLVYSTCTVFSNENRLMIEDFLKEHKDFEPCDFSVSSLSSKDGMLELYPDIHGTDGFFIARLRRK